MENTPKNTSDPDFRASAPVDSGRQNASSFPLVRFWRTVTEPHTSIQEIGERRLATLAISLIVAIGLLNFSGFLASMVSTSYQEAVGGFGIALVGLVVAYALTKTKYHRAGIFVFAIVFAASAYTDILRQKGAADISADILVFVPLSLIVASTFLSGWAIFLLVGLNIGALVSLPIFGIATPANLGGLAGSITTIGLVLILLGNFRNRTEALRLEDLRKINRQLEKLTGSLEARVNERTIALEKSVEQIKLRATQLEAIASTARLSAVASNLDQMLTNITRQVGDRFGFYHVGIFLLDDNSEYALLQAANSPGGQRMLARGHRLKVGEQGIVGYVTLSRLPRIALDVGADAVYFNNPDLPDTHSEVALPLKFGNEIIGALDIQSKESNAFTQEDIGIFTILADQVSVAIQNTRLLEQTRRALREAESASTQLTGQAWRGYAQTIQTRGFRYDGVKAEALKEAPNPGNNDDGMFIPIRLRGRTIGKLKFKTAEPLHAWTEDEKAIIEAAAERMALALDSARLLDDAQKRAARETFLSQVGARLGASFQMDSIMRDTVEELGQVMKGSTVSFQLVNPSAGTEVNDENHD